jgi:hypothetical protein
MENLFSSEEQFLALFTIKIMEKFNIQGTAFNITHFESRITHLLYTAINTTEHG